MASLDMRKVSVFLSGARLSPVCVSDILPLAESLNVSIWALASTLYKKQHGTTIIHNKYGRVRVFKSSGDNNNNRNLHKTKAKL